MIADTLRAARTLSNSLSSSQEDNFNYPIIQDYQIRYMHTEI